MMRPLWRQRPRRHVLRFGGLALAAVVGLFLARLVGASLLHSLHSSLLGGLVPGSMLLSVLAAFAVGRAPSSERDGPRFRRLARAWIGSAVVLLALEVAFTGEVWVSAEEGGSLETRGAPGREGEETGRTIRLITGWPPDLTVESCLLDHSAQELHRCWRFRLPIELAFAFSYLVLLLTSGALLGVVTVPPPLRILVVISTPEDEGYEKLSQAELEWRDLCGIVQVLVGQGKVEVDRIPPTIRSLQSRLRTGKAVHVLHFVGHGSAEVLVLEDDERRGQRVEGEAFAGLLKDCSALRLVVLNSCNGASFRGDGALAGMARTLALSGVPAVVAMRSKIKDATARRFAECFYRAFADLLPVEACMGEARKALAAERSSEWEVPVLYRPAAGGAGVLEI